MKKGRRQIRKLKSKCYAAGCAVRVEPPWTHCKEHRRALLNAAP